LVDLIEAMEIKKHWPRHNRSMKRVTLNYGLFKYTDRNGYDRFNIGRAGKHDKPVISFKSQAELKNYLKDLITDYNLCPRLGGLQPLSSGKCNYIEDLDCRGACTQSEKPATYNLRVQQAVEERVERESTYVLKQESADGASQAIVLVEKGRYKGYGMLDIKDEIENIEFIKTKIHSAYDDQDLSIIVNASLRKAQPQDIVYL